MSSQNQWVMNCVLTGAEALKHLKQDRADKAQELLGTLSSELKPEGVDYLLFRLQQLLPI